jgi:hypothetical protein
VTDQAQRTPADQAAVVRFDSCSHALSTILWGGQELEGAVNDIAAARAGPNRAAGQRPGRAPSRAARHATQDNQALGRLHEQAGVTGVRGTAAVITRRKRPFSSCARRRHPRPSEIEILQSVLRTALRGLNGSAKK